MATLDVTYDATSGVDALLYQPAPTTNFGTYNMWEIGSDSTSANHRERVLFKPDLSSIPAAATINSAHLYLTLAVNVQGSPTIKAYLVLLAAGAWTEAGVTWNTMEGSTAWPGSAGCGTAGTDRSATELASVACGGMAAGDVVDFNFSAAEFSNLLSGNYGILFKEDAEPASYTRIQGASSDHATVAHPRLVVDFTAASGSLVIPNPMRKFQHLLVR